MTNARDLIMGTSSPAMAFTYPGDAVMGKIITEPKAVQQTVYDPRNPASKDPAFWPSGDPKMQVIFQVATAFRNHEGIKNPDRSQPDNGNRTIYLKGKHMERATAEAIRAVGAEWLEVGGTVWYRFTGEDMTSLAGVKPKLFEVRYQPPAAQPPAHFSQTQGQQGYPGNGYRPNDPGPVNPGPYGVVAAPVPNWQTPGWRPDAPVPQGPYPPQGNPFPQPPAPAQRDPASSWDQHQERQDVGDPWTTPARQGTPSHHGQPDQMPDWAKATGGTISAPPAPSSAPPAPQLSTLEAIRAAQASGTPDYGSIQPAF